MEDFDWKGMVILSKLREGCTVREAAASAGITKEADLKRRRKSPAFSDPVILASEAGADERAFRLWLRHPFRGKRPPKGKGRGGKPNYIFGKR